MTLSRQISRLESLLATDLTEDDMAAIINICRYFHRHGDDGGALSEEQVAAVGEMVGRLGE